MSKPGAGMSKRMNVKRVPIKRFEQTRRWSGHLFKFIERNLLKGDADRTAKTLRYKGNYVRVIRTSLGFEVWACPKRKRSK